MSKITKQTQREETIFISNEFNGWPHNEDGFGELEITIVDKKECDSIFFHYHYKKDGSAPQECKIMIPGDISRAFLYLIELYLGTDEFRYIIE